MTTDTNISYFAVPQVMTVRQVADALLVSPQTVYNMIDDGRLVAFSLSDRRKSALRIRVADFQAFVDGRMAACAPLVPPVPQPDIIRSDSTPEHLRPATDVKPVITPEQLPPAKPKRDKTIRRPDGTPDIAAMARARMKVA